jgi:hypothetical protein
MVEIKNKGPTTRQRLDALIDFYEQHRPDAGKYIQINTSPTKLAQILKYAVAPNKEPPREQRYRNRVIVAVGVERPRKKKEGGEALSAQMTI